MRKEGKRWIYDVGCMIDELRDLLQGSPQISAYQKAPLPLSFFLQYSLLDIRYSIPRQSLCRISNIEQGVMNNE
jgi:hypothetical protein